MRNSLCSGAGARAASVSRWQEPPDCRGDTLLYSCLTPDCVQRAEKERYEFDTSIGCALAVFRDLKFPRSLGEVFCKAFKFPEKQMKRQYLKHVHLQEKESNCSVIRKFSKLVFKFLNILLIFQGSYLSYIGHF